MLFAQKSSVLIWASAIWFLASSIQVSQVARCPYVSAPLTTRHQVWHGQLFSGKIPGEQGFIVLQGRGQGQLVEDIPQIGVRFQLIGLGGLDQAIEQRTGLGAFGSTGKEPVFSCREQKAECCSLPCCSQCRDGYPQCSQSAGATGLGVTSRLIIYRGGLILYSVPGTCFKECCSLANKGNFFPFNHGHRSSPCCSPLPGCEASA